MQVLRWKTLSLSHRRTDIRQSAAKTGSILLNAVNGSGQPRCATLYAGVGTEWALPTQGKAGVQLRKGRFS
jgi:hypothetical protein